MAGSACHGGIGVSWQDGPWTRSRDQDQDHVHELPDQATRTTTHPGYTRHPGYTVCMKRVLVLRVKSVVGLINKASSD